LTKCEWCHEELLPEERNPATPFFEMHSPCGFRAIMGSLAHLQGRCSCVNDTLEETDPPGMTLRQGAEAAFTYWASLTPEERSNSFLRRAK
jgi:hypothetical protein